VPDAFNAKMSRQYPAGRLVIPRKRETINEMQERLDQATVEDLTNYKGKKQEIWAVRDRYKKMMADGAEGVDDAYRMSDELNPTL